MDRQFLFEQAFGVIKEHKLFLAAMVIVALPDVLYSALQGSYPLGAFVMVLVMQPLYFGGLYMALKAWRNEPLVWGQLLYCYRGGRLGRSVLYALVYCGAALLAGLAIGVGVVLSAFFGILAPVGMLAAAFFGLAVLGIFIYPMVLAYLDDPKLSIGEAYSQGRSLTEGKFKPLLGIAWGIFWRLVLVAALPEILAFSLGTESPVSMVIQAVLGYIVTVYTIIIIAGVWQQLLPKGQPSSAKDSTALAETLL